MLRFSPFGRCHFTHGYTRRVVFHYKYNPISIQNKKPRFVRNRVFKRLEGYARLSEAKGGDTKRSDCAAPLENKKACSFEQAFQKKGGDILSHITAVPSAQSGLTSLFGMERGEPRRNNHLKFLVQGNGL